MQKGICLWTLLSIVFACGRAQPQSDLSLRDLTKDELLSDFTQLSANVKNVYGPLEYKEERFNFKIDDVIAQTRESILKSATTDEAIGAMGKFLAKFEDGHVSYWFDPFLDETKTYTIPVFITPVQGKALVVSIGSELKESNAGLFGERPIVYGDELVSVDGKTTAEILEILKQYKSFGNDKSDEHMIYLALRRPFYITELKPEKDTARLIFKAADGTEYRRTLTWNVVRSKALDPRLPSDLKGSWFYNRNAVDFNEAANGSIMQMGGKEPFFVNPVTRRIFDLSQVVPDKGHREKFGIKDTDKLPDVFAAMYRYNEKNILLVRQPSYTPENPDIAIKYYKALLNQFERFVDVLVIDQNHNPGGSLLYVNDFFRLFISSPQANLVQHVNTDRNWISTFRAWGESINGDFSQEVARSFLARANTVEQAYDAGLPYTAPMTLFGDETLAPFRDFQWKRPILVLADELAGSCGDIFPMFMKRSKTATIFGQRTMGLGGNVVPSEPLNYSKMQYTMTRGLFTSFHEGEYTRAELVENNGIEPDIVYNHTVQDFRMAYLGYVKAFSEAAVSLTK